MTELVSRLLRASAGTGKTYRLVSEYAELVVAGGLRPTEIVAITFTRKAAAELRTRIRKRLHDRGCDRALLSELDQAPIGNFHGLSLQFLRGLGGTVGVTDGTTILGDDGEDVALFRRACEEAWFDRETLDEAALAKVAGALRIDALPGELWHALSLAREDGASLDAGALFGSYSPAAVRADLMPRVVALRAKLDAARTKVTPKTREKIESFLAASSRLDTLSDEAWAAACAEAASHLDRRGGLKAFYEEVDRDLLTVEVTAVDSEQRCAALVPHLAHLLGAAWQRYGELKLRQRALDFADVVERLVSVLETDAVVQRQICGRFRVIFVDEAQDTNHLQRRLVHLLAGLAGPATGAVEATPLVMVGDRKQAIYTFRGADPASFERFAADISRLGGAQEELATSYRSSPALVHAINSLGEELFREQYERLVARGASTSRAFEPAMHWLSVGDTTDGKAGDRLTQVMSEAQLLARWVRKRCADGVAPGSFALLLRAMPFAPLYVSALQEQGVPVVIGGGGGLYEQSEVQDLVALWRWLSDGSDYLAAAIALRSPLIGLSDSALLRLLGPAGRAHRDLDALRRGVVPGCLAGLEQDASTSVWLSSRLPALASAAASFGPARFVRDVAATLDLRPVLHGLSGGEQRVANLDRLTELADQLESRGVLHVLPFVRVVQERIDSAHHEPLAPLAGGARGALTVSTVHAAKGLEFGRVLLADLDRRRAPELRALRYVRDHGVVMRPRGGDGVRVPTQRWREAERAAAVAADEEERRLLYVAVTRAKESVVFVGRPAHEPVRGVFARLLAPWRSRAVEAGVLSELPPPEDVRPFPAAATRGAARIFAMQTRASHAAALPATSRITLAVTGLETYVQCLRRGQLVHELGLRPSDPEASQLREREELMRDPPLDPLARGRLAHTLLANMERRSDHASASEFVDAELRAAGYEPADDRLGEVREDVVRFLDSQLGRVLTALPSSARRHELPFCLRLDAAPYQLELRGQIDLLYFDDDGPVVVDFKHARAQPHAIAAYALQLQAYALAVLRMTGAALPLRTRLVFLRDAPLVHEELVDHRTLQSFEAAAAHVARTFGERRGRRQVWPGVALDVCRTLGCGFVGRCHPPGS